MKLFSINDRCYIQPTSGQLLVQHKLSSIISSAEGNVVYCAYCNHPRPEARRAPTVHNRAPVGRAASTCKIPEYVVLVPRRPEPQLMSKQVRRLLVPLFP
jgi:hypothetical protein